jgi:cytochrome P450
MMSRFAQVTQLSAAPRQCPGMEFPFKVVTRWPICRARVREFFSRHPLPPGKLIALDVAEKSNQRLLLELAAEHGSVFKVMAWNELWICIIGLDRCLRFINENKHRIRPVTIDVTRLYPKGFLRQMLGDEHRVYRKSLITAFRDEQVPNLRPELREIADTVLADYVRRQSTGEPPTPESLIDALNEISSRQLIRIYFGASGRADFTSRLLAGYKKMGPHGLVWNQGPRQEEAFHVLRNAMLDDLRAHPEETSGVARRLHAAGALDETMLGHVIMMIEMGRYDMQGLFRWLLRYAGRCPEIVDRIARENEGEPSAGNSLARSFVLETFRMDQSERVIRRAEQDILFDGYLIPRHSKIRLCLWESHKSAEYFTEPFVFNPDRFLAGDFPGDQFSPFGLDEHYCPLAETAILLGTLFVRAVAQRYKIEPIADGTPQRGAYSWEPSASFTVRLVPREPRDA